MFRPDMKRFVRKVMTLMVLVAALVVLSSGLQGKRASAAVCCSTCIPQYEDCLANCPNPGMCNPVCNFQLHRCQNTCTPSC